MPSTDVTKIEVTDAEGQTFSLYLYHDAGELKIVHTAFETDQTAFETDQTAVNNRDEAWDKYMEALNKKLKADDKERKAWNDYIEAKEQ